MPVSVPGRPKESTCGNNHFINAYITEIPKEITDMF